MNQCEIRALKWAVSLVLCIYGGLLVLGYMLKQ